MTAFEQSRESAAQANSKRTPLAATVRGHRLGLPLIRVRHEYEMPPGGIDHPGGKRRY
jgi:hypothetical protein